MEHTDRPVMDAASQNYDIAVPTVIPSAKVAARHELADLMKTAPAITYCSYRRPRGPNKWKPGKIAANDNEKEVLPVIEALRRDKRESDIHWVLRYRMLCEVVGATPYDDEAGLGEEGINVEARSLRLSGKAFDKSFQKMTAISLPGGEISYREQRHTVKQRVSIGQHTNSVADEDADRTQTPLRLAKSEDERIARIDGQPILAALRAGIGDLLVPLEDAILDGLTMTEIGDSLGFKWKARSAEAKWRVYAGIDRMRDQWRMIDRQMAAEAAACDRRVEVRRNELAAARASYLGLAA